MAFLSRNTLSSTWSAKIEPTWLILMKPHPGVLAKTLLAVISQKRPDIIGRKSSPNYQGIALA